MDTMIFLFCLSVLTMYDDENDKIPLTVWGLEASDAISHLYLIYLYGDYHCIFVVMVSVGIVEPDFLEDKVMAFHVC